VVLARGTGHFVEISREKLQKSVRDANPATADGDLKKV
jgi:hypothetical protein